MVGRIRFIAVLAMVIVLSSLIYTLYWSRGQELIRELRVAISTDISTLDISYATGVSDFEILGKVYESLFRIDFDPRLKKLTYIPWLVESYRCINDTYCLFILRNGVSFHNGEKLTAWDVKASIERAIEVSPIGKMLLRDGYGDPVIESIIVYNSSSFALKLRRPFAPLIEHLAHLAVAIMPRTVVEKYGSGRIDSAADVIGTGPYRVVEYLRGQYVRLQRFNGYWRGEPRIESIVYTIVPDPNARIAAIETGQIDIAIGIPPEAVKQLELKGLRIYRETGVRLVIVAINTQRIPDLRIRQAMNYAVDRRAIVDTMMMGFAAVANSIVSPIFPGAASLDSYSYSPEKARQLIDEAGGVNRRLALLVSTRSPKDLELAQVVQSFLSSVGIDVEIQAMEHTAFLKKVFTEHDFDLAIYGPSPSSLYYALTYWRSGAALNAPLYSNPEVDKLLDEVTRESDRDRQYEIYRRIQEIIWFECPAIWLYYEDIIVATRPGVEDLRILPFQMLILDSITIKG